jgi:hypothetical protein
MIFLLLFQLAFACNENMTHDLSDEAIGYISKQLASTKKTAIRGRLEHYNGASSEYFLYLSSEHKNVKKMFSKNRWDELNQLDFQLSDTDRTLKELFKINYDQNVISLKEGDEFIAIKNGEIFFHTKSEFASVQMRGLEDEYIDVLMPHGLEPEKWLEATEQAYDFIVLRKPSKVEIPMMSPN